MATAIRSDITKRLEKTSYSTYHEREVGTSSLDEASALKIEEKLVTHPDLTVIMITHHLRKQIQMKLDGILVLS